MRIWIKKLIYGLVFALGGLATQPGLQAAELATENPSEGYHDRTIDELYRLAKDAETRKQRSFFKPNEKDPLRMLPITSQAPAGTLVSVGTERGFITIALNAQLTNATFIDYDARAVLYSRVNIALLKIAHSYDDYVWLRTKATSVDVAARLTAAMPEFHVHAIRWFLFMLREQTPDQLSPELTYFAPEGNYVARRDLCERLIALAKADRLSAHLVDISNLAEVTRWQRWALAPQSISVFDISNAWWARYVGLDGTEQALKTMRPYFAPNAIVQATQPKGLDWSYVGFSAHNGWHPQEWQNISSQLVMLKADYDNGISSTAWGKIMKPNAPLPRQCEMLFAPN